jgi:hypothetical protein
MTNITTDNPLLLRAKALKLYGLLAHWDEVAGAAWIKAPDPVGGARTGAPLARTAPRQRSPGALPAPGRLRLGLAQAL